MQEPANNKQQNQMFSDQSVIKTVMEHASDSIYFKDLAGRFVYVNQVKARHNGLADPAGMIGKTDYDFIAENDAAEIARQEQCLIETGQPIVGRIERFTRQDGQIAWVSVSKSPVYGPDQQIIGIWGISRDITETETAKAALTFHEQKYRIMIESISEIIEIIDINGLVQYASPNMRKLFDWTNEELIGQSCFKYIHSDDQTILQKKFDEIICKPGATAEAEFKNLSKDGSYKHIELSGVNLLDNPYINGILVNYHDISDRKKQEDKIRFLSYHDVLTHLYNRSFFEEEKLRLDTERQLPFSIIMGDVNGLKLTNDAYGHAEGDKLLIEIAGIMKKSCRKEEIIARIGGDEFCILMPKTDANAAQKVCNRIYAACKSKGKQKNAALHPSISLGHATKTKTTQSLDQIIKEAEDYMYQHKLLERDTTRSSILHSIQATLHETSIDTEEHAERMVILSLQLGKVLKLPDEKLLELDLFSRLHDIGKICIDESILSKPGKLTDEEWVKVRRHPEVGYRIAQASTELVRIADLILSHHERWDGKGYPQGLSGPTIPLLSRIIAIVDAYDAMTQDRPYRKAMSKEYAINEIIDNANKQFDPEIARIFVEQVLGEPWQRRPCPEKK